MNAQDDPHAFECYSCELGSSPPASTPACRGCINRNTRPHWRPAERFKQAAIAAIAKATKSSEADGKGIAP